MKSRQGPDRLAKKPDAPRANSPEAPSAKLPLRDFELRQETLPFAEAQGLLIMRTCSTPSLEVFDVNVCSN
jgi:hypothetical protein